MRSTGICLAALAACVHADIPADRVTTVPGLKEALPTKHWSGYIQVPNPATGGGSAFVHYYLVENAAKDPKAPTLVWNNGGPGSSSMMGLMTENGPITLNDDSFNTDEYAATGVPTVFLNPHSWNTAPANVLYIEHPAPTGFSYCSPGDCGTWNDTTQAEAQYRVLESFFKSYPELAKNDFYMSGESYAGVLVPTCALQILKYRTDANKDTAPWSLKGFALGNDCPGNRVETCTPYSGWIGTKTALDFRYGHGMVKEETYQKIQEVCKGQWGTYDPPSDDCKALLGDPINPVVEETGPVDDMGGGYFLYDICAPDLEALSGKGKLRGTPTREGAAERRAAKGQPYNLGGGEYACGQERGGHVWLNLPEVQAALHVKLVGKKTFEWSAWLKYDYTAHTLVPTYNKTLIPAFRIWQYSGDADPCVPYVGTQRWIDTMQLPIEDTWRPWTAPGTMPVTGYVTKYAANGFHFVTFRASGHMTPRYKPREALYFIQKYLADGKL